jgi:hypothetical protein
LLYDICRLLGKSGHLSIPKSSIRNDMRRFLLLML